MGRKAEQLLEPEAIEWNRTVHFLKDSWGILSGKWKLPVIVALMKGPLRFMEIQRMIQDISPRVLSKELKDLEAGGFVLRTVHPSTPVVVEYNLLPFCDTLKPLINELLKWAVENKKTIQGML